MKKVATTIGLYAVVLVGVPALLLEHGRMPPFAGRGFLFIFGIWTAFFAWRFVRARKSKRGGALLFNLAFLCFALLVAEGIAHLAASTARIVVSPRTIEYVQRDPDLGYTPIPGVAARFKKVAGDDLIFDVTYHIEDDGIRRRPPRRDPKGSLLCFGCSFTYGMGLPDEATIPYRLEEELDGTVRVHNFGFSGWGPHQMLANIESGRVAKIVEAPPKVAIYLAIEDHTRRVAGIVAHDRHGPRYVRSDDGLVRRDGSFHDDQISTFRKRAVRLLHHSKLARAILRLIEKTQGDDELLARTAKAAEVRLQERWPECRFVVLLWDEEAHDVGSVRAALEAKGLEVLPASRLHPALLEAPESCWIHEEDKHPNATSAAAIAMGLAAQVAPPLD